jgi:hypothetical protein
MVSDQSYYLGILSIVIIMVLCCIVYHPDTVQDTMVTDGMGAFETDISDPTTVKTITVAKMHECIAAIKFISGENLAPCTTLWTHRGVYTGSISKQITFETNTHTIMTVSSG